MAVDQTCHSGQMEKSLTDPKHVLKKYLRGKDEVSGGVCLREEGLSSGESHNQIGRKDRRVSNTLKLGVRLVLPTINWQLTKTSC
jgi:hypothetical protein